MQKQYKLGVIGAGFMSSAILDGVINSKVLTPQQIIVSDLSKDALDRVAKKGVSVTFDNKVLANGAEFVLFAIKPQNATAVLEEIKNSNTNKFVSIMAGVKKEKIKKYFPFSLVARCMPNTPCSLGKGATGLDCTDFSNKKDVDFIKRLFSSLGEVVSVPEELLSAVTGVSGSAPAYFYLFLKTIVEAGIKHGLSEEQAKKLAVNTMIGAGEMVKKNTDKSLDDLINAVCSKGGTTIEAIKIYYEKGLSEISSQAIDACVARSKELESL